MLKPQPPPDRRCSADEPYLAPFCQKPTRAHPGRCLLGTPRGKRASLSREAPLCRSSTSAANSRNACGRPHYLSSSSTASSTERTQERPCIRTRQWLASPYAGSSLQAFSSVRARALVPRSQYIVVLHPFIHTIPIKSPPLTTTTTPHPSPLTPHPSLLRKSPNSASHFLHFAGAGGAGLRPPARPSRPGDQRGFCSRGVQ